MVHGKVAEKSRKSRGDSPTIGPQPKHHRAAPSTRTLPTPIRTPTLMVGTESAYPYIDKTLFSPTRTVVGDFRLRGLSWVILAHEDCRRCAYQHVDPSVDCRVILDQEDCPSVRISSLSPFPCTIAWVIFAHEDCPWVIFAHEDCRRCAYQHVGPSMDCRVIFAHERGHRCAYQHVAPSVDYPWVILAHEDCRRCAYQHVGPYRGLSGDFSPRGQYITHEDCRRCAYQHVGPSVDYPWVIFATRTVVGDFRHEDCPWVISPTTTVVDAHINTLALPWTVGTVVGDFCPRGLSWVIFAHEDCRLCAYQHVDPSVDCRVLLSPRGLSVDAHINTLALPWTVGPRGQYISTHIDALALPVDCPWVIFAHEDCPSVDNCGRAALPRADLASDACLWGEAPTEVGNRAAAHAIKRAFTLLFHHEISVLVELILGHLRYLLTDVPPQPNSPPDNVLRRIDRERVLGLKKGLLPASDSRIGCSARESSKERSQSVPGRHEAVALATLAAQAARQRVGGLELGPRAQPSSQSFSEVTDPFCRLPLPTLFHRPEAVHLGDLMRL
ncbi:hypothetical protein Bca101_100917 [Brassica carinata]